jgi:hypothetical protein
MYHRTEAEIAKKVENSRGKNLLEVSLRSLLAWAVPFGPSEFKLSPWRLVHQACLLPM